MNKKNRSIKESTKVLVKFMALCQGISFLILGLVRAIIDDPNKNSDLWFKYWSLGILCLTCWGIMEHLNDKS